MKSFLDSIKNRLASAKLTLSKTAELAKLESDVIAAKTEFEKFRNIQAVGDRKSEAHAVWTAAEQALTRFRDSLSAAENVIKDSAPLLSAHADLKNAHAAFHRAQTDAIAAGSEVANLERLGDELSAEILELSASAGSALEQHGQNSVAARLSGQSAPQTPKAVLMLSADLASRQATLDHSQAMLTSARQRLADAIRSADDSRAKWEHSRYLIAEVEHRDLLATILPKVAAYLASIPNGVQDETTFAPGWETINLARELLRRELESTPAQG